MECLQNIIGLRGCGEPVTNPEPQLFINELPGVSIENIEALADNEQETFLGVWADVQKRAFKKFALLAKAEFNKCYKITDNTVISCLVCENVDLFAVALWYLLGSELMIERTSSDVINQYTTIDLEKAEKLKAEFFAEFQASLTDAVNSINPKDSDCIQDCLECNDTIKFVTQLP